MEQHPIPQNVTTFQFRLIGDMTIKQFAYLAGGTITAYIAYKLPLPFFFTYPLATICAFLGIGFAFVPIEERPMDVWVLSFIKNIYAPTQFLWQKSSAEDIRRSATMTNNQPTAPLPSGASPSLDARLTPTISPAPQKKPGLWQAFMDFVNPKPVQTPLQPLTQPTLNPTKTETIPAPQPILPAVAQIAQTPIPTVVSLPQAPPPVNTEMDALKRQLETALKKQQELAAQLEANKKSPPPVPTPTPPKPVQSSTSTVSQTVKVITPAVAVKAGLPRLTTFPNIPSGIIKDNEGNFLPGILVTIKDRDNIPVRALKTNKLGQFAASTQLPNGTYYIEIEDPRTRFTFDRAQITLNGAIMPPIEIIAKSQKQLNRELLSRQIFGSQQTT